MRGRGGRKDRKPLSHHPLPPEPQSLHCLPALLACLQVKLSGSPQKSLAPLGTRAYWAAPFQGCLSGPGMLGSPSRCRGWGRFGSASVSLHKSGQTLMCEFLTQNPDANASRPRSALLVLSSVLSLGISVEGTIFLPLRLHPGSLGKGWQIMQNVISQADPLRSTYEASLE